jgi:hypothetical protein
MANTADSDDELIDRANSGDLGAAFELLDAINGTAR